MPLTDEMEELSVQCGKILLDMERFKYCAGEAGDKDPGRGGPGFGSGEGLRARQSPCVVGLGHFSVPRILRVLCGYFEHRRRVRFAGCTAEPLHGLSEVTKN